LEDLEVDGKLILKCVIKNLDRDLAQDRERWRAVVYAVMNLWVP
jgi:hypothetical protein